MLPPGEAPTGAPTDEIGAGEWWPDYSTAWSEAGCKTGPPVGFNHGDRPTYESELECCTIAYRGQTSGACLSGLPAPPTGAPSTEVDFWWPDYSMAWSVGECKQGPPVGFNRGDRPEVSCDGRLCRFRFLAVFFWSTRRLTQRHHSVFLRVGVLLSCLWRPDLRRVSCQPSLSAHRRALDGAAVVVAVARRDVVAVRE